MAHVDRRWTTSAAAGVVAVLVAAMLSGCFRDDGRVTGSVPWELVRVSADARTLTIFHEAPHCETHAGRAVVRETERAVVITVPELSSHLGRGEGCTADLRMEQEAVRLAAPLGHRRLSQPAPRGSQRDAVDPNRLVRIGAPECTTLLRLPPDAPAHQVPWVATRLRACNAPLPRLARELPILQRSRTAADHLPRSLVEEAAHSQRILRPTLARRIAASVPVWFVPGPKTSCLGRLVQGHAQFTACRATSVVARRGAYASTTCTNSTPRAVTLIGFVPAGVDRVHLAPKRGRARWVAVHDGVWRARTPYPLEITFGVVRFRTDFLTRSCWY